MEYGISKTYWRIWHGRTPEAITKGEYEEALRHKPEWRKPHEVTT